MTYTAPPDQVIIESDPARATELLMDPEEWRPFGAGAARVAPACLTRLSGSLQSPIPQASGAGVTFLHERCSKSGLRRLVVVSASLDMEEATDIGLAVPVMEVRPLVDALALLWPLAERTSLGRARSPHPAYRIFAGQVDPDDESHFTIAYEQAGEKGITDGWLLNDGTVKLVIRSGPATHRRPMARPALTPKLIPLAPSSSFHMWLTT